MRRRSLVLVLPMALIAAQTVSATAAARPNLALRVASPDGMGTACTAADPCDIVTAINSAPAHSRVEITPGTYGSPALPLTTSLSDASNGHLDIFGVAGSPAPLIYDDAIYAINLDKHSSLSHVDLTTAAAGAGVFDRAGSVTGVVVLSSATTDGACSGTGTFTDSLCVTTGSSDPAIGINAGADTDITFRGVTAEATGPNGVGLLVRSANTGNDVEVSVTNSIIHGSATDVSLVAAAASATAQVTLTNSDSKTKTSTGPGTSSVHRDSTDTAAAPKFVAATTSNFKEKAGSPTIDMGATVAAGDTDVIGTPRPLGAAPDIGAYEFLPKPTARSLTVTQVTKRAAHVSVTVNPEGLRTTVEIVAQVGRHLVTSHPVPAGTLRTPRTVHLVLRRLKGDTKYTVYAVAHSSGGSTKSATTKLRTR